MFSTLIAVMCLAAAVAPPEETPAPIQAAPAPAPVVLRIDHVTIAWSDLTTITRSMAWQGLRTEFGGAHSNGVTHMAHVGLPDSSYIEVVAPIQSGNQDLPIWKDFMLKDGGFCGWSARSNDVSAEVARLKGLGLPAMGPVPGSRTKPDGTRIDWQLAFMADGMPFDNTLPFFIQDITPRKDRITPAVELAGSYLKGIKTVVIGVRDIDATARVFQKAFHWPAPVRQDHAQFGAKLAYFEGSPVMLAQPLAADNWLAQRIAQFGEAPCAILIDTLDAQVATDGIGPEPADPQWFGKPVMWIKERQLRGVRIGFTE